MCTALWFKMKLKIVMCINQDDGIHLQEDTTCTTRFIEAAYGKLNLSSNSTTHFCFHFANIFVMDLTNFVVVWNGSFILKKQYFSFSLLIFRFQKLNHKRFH